MYPRGQVIGVLRLDVRQRFVWLAVDRGVELRAGRLHRRLAEDMRVRVLVRGHVVLGRNGRVAAVVVRAGGVGRGRGEVGRDGGSRGGLKCWRGGLRSERLAY